MTREEMEIWQQLRTGCLGILMGARGIRQAMPLHPILERLDGAGVLPATEAFLAECNERLGIRTPRKPE